MIIAFKVTWNFHEECDSGALTREAPWVTKCGKLPIRENLVIT